jgi:ABC-type transporter Mla maintaining outer membrane lipid asymmetry ATPase subunit MlaF
MICDRVAMLDSGTIRFCGTPDEFRVCPDPVVQAFVDRAAAEAALDMVSESYD